LLFFNIIVTNDDGSDKHIFNTLCIKLYHVFFFFFSIELKCSCMQCHLIFSFKWKKKSIFLFLFFFHCFFIVDSVQQHGAQVNL
jgi:hypothetical protein